MTSEIYLERSAHGLKPDCLSFGEVLAQSFAVIAPTTIPASNIGLIVALAGNGAWLSFLIGLMGLVLVSININQFASRSASPGSLYSFLLYLAVTCGWFFKQCLRSPGIVRAMERNINDIHDRFTSQKVEVVPVTHRLSKIYGQNKEGG